MTVEPSGHGNGSGNISPWRLLLVIVPLIVILATAAALLGLWTSRSSKHAARDEGPAPADRLPVEQVPPIVPAPDADQGTERFDAAAVVALLEAATPLEGAAVFRMCAPCHTSTKGDASIVGPNLWGVAGREKASRPDFSYSVALKAKGGRWSDEDLAKFIHNPRAYAPGTSMAFRGISENARIANLIAYLRTLSDNPAPR